MLRTLASGARLSVVHGTASVWWTAGTLRVSGALVGRLARRGWVSTRRIVLDGAVELSDDGAAIVAPRSRWSPKIAARMAAQREA